MMFYINQNTQMRCANFFCWLASKMGPISVARAARRRSQWPCPSAWGAMCSGHALASSTAPHPSPPPLPSYPGGVSAMVAPSETTTLMVSMLAHLVPQRLTPGGDFSESIEIIFIDFCYKTKPTPKKKRH